MQDLITADGQCPFSPPRAPPPGFSHFLFAAAAAAQNQAHQQLQLPGAPGLPHPHPHAHPHAHAHPHQAALAASHYGQQQAPLASQPGALSRPLAAAGPTLKEAQEAAGQAPQQQIMMRELDLFLEQQKQQQQQQQKGAPMVTSSCPQTVASQSQPVATSGANPHTPSQSIAAAISASPHFAQFFSAAAGSPAFQPAGPYAPPVGSIEHFLMQQQHQFAAAMAAAAAAAAHQHQHQQHQHQQQPNLNQQQGQLKAGPNGCGSPQPGGAPEQASPIGAAKCAARSAEMLSAGGGVAPQESAARASAHEQHGGALPHPHSQAAAAAAAAALSSFLAGPLGGAQGPSNGARVPPAAAGAPPGGPMGTLAAAAGYPFDPYQLQALVQHQQHQMALHSCLAEQQRQQQHQLAGHPSQHMQAPQPSALSQLQPPLQQQQAQAQAQQQQHHLLNQHH